MALTVQWREVKVSRLNFLLELMGIDTLDVEIGEWKESRMVC